MSPPIYAVIAIITLHKFFYNKLLFVKKFMSYNKNIIFIQRLEKIYL